MTGEPSRVGRRQRGSMWDGNYGLPHTVVTEVYERESALTPVRSPVSPPLSAIRVAARAGARRLSQHWCGTVVV
jgi:hypothetical protein